MSDRPSERTPGGSEIYRHEEVGEGSPPAPAAATLAALREHLRARLGPSRELPAPPGAPSAIALEVFEPEDESEPVTVMTLGASATAMPLPPGVQQPARFELLLRLPRSWPLSSAATTLERRDGWPLHWLRAMAQLPARFGSWLGPGHTIPNGDPPRPFAEGTELASFVLLPPACLEEGEELVSTPDGPVLLLAALPIHAAELTLLLERGVAALIERLVAAGVDDVLELSRPSVA